MASSASGTGHITPHFRVILRGAAPGLLRVGMRECDEERVRDVGDRVDPQAGHRGKLVAAVPGHQRGAPYTFLGVLNSLRPAALGGDPAQGRAYFERAIELSAGRDLMAKVLFAEHYARLNFDRALHDSLLTEVLEAEPEADGYTLGNLLAQQRAQELLANAGDYFFDE